MTKKDIINISAHLTSANLTHYALDTFIAPKLSELTTCGANKLADYPNFGAALRLNRIFTLGGVRKDAVVLMENFISRLEFAANEYRDGRESLNEYTEGLSNRKLAPYFLAVFHFENCIFHLFTAILLMRRLIIMSGEHSFFEAKDGSEYDRLRILFNRVKHFDEDIDKAETANGDVLLRPLWISNVGLESERGSLSFEDLFGIITVAFAEAKFFAEELPKEIEKHRAAATEPRGDSPHRR